MKRSIDLDDDLAAEVDQTAALVREKPATIIRLAIRAGLPSVSSRFQAPRPEGYFEDAYPLPGDRRRLEKAMSKLIQRPDRGESTSGESGSRVRPASIQTIGF